MSILNKLSLTGVLVIGAAIAVYAWSSDKQSEQPQNYGTAKATLGRLTESVNATGVIRPIVGAEINVGSRVSGTVLSLPVKVGDKVVKGQLLAELDATSFHAEVDEQRAAVALALPKVTLAESILRSRQQLADRDLTSTMELDTAKRDLAVEQAGLEVSRARLRSAEISLSYTRIRAPISGVVAGVSTREGETIAANFAAPTFVTILDLNQLEVLAYVDETDIGRIKAGQQAVFTVDTYPGQEFQASVNAIQPRAEIQGSVVNYVVRLNFQLVAGFILRPEMTAHVRVSVAQRNRVIKVPRNVLRRKEGVQFVLVKRDDKWVEQAVRTGWRSEKQVEILNGLSAGAVLAINP